MPKKNVACSKNQELVLPYEKKTVPSQNYTFSYILVVQRSQKRLIKHEYPVPSFFAPVYNKKKHALQPYNNTRYNIDIGFRA
jgi:hypothetical protein